jgi:hypothetical protein
LKQIETINEVASDEEKMKSPKRDQKKVLPVEKPKEEFKPPIKESEPKYKHNSFII